MKLDISNTEHKILINKIFEGKIVLFTGSGFSIGAKNKNDSLPNVASLKKILINDVLSISEEDTDFDELIDFSLQKICDECESYNKSLFNKVLLNNFKVSDHTDFHLLYGKVPWKKIYTLNIDDLMEIILEKNNVDFVTQDSGYLNYKDKSELELFKLHGSVRNSSAGFIFSKLSYIQKAAAITKDRRLLRLIDDLDVENFLFIGTSLTDELEIEIEFLKQEGIAPNKFYFVSPGISNKRIKKSILQKSFANMEFIDETSESFIRKLIEYKSGFVNYSDQGYEGEVESLGFDLITKEKYADDGYLSPNMYIGKQPTWNDIFTNHDVITQKTKKVFKEMNNHINNTNCFIIHDKAISGKTTLLYRVGAMLSNNDNIVLEFKGSNLVMAIDELKGIINRFKISKRVVVLLDDASWTIDKLFEILDKINGESISIILTMRTGVYEKKIHLFSESNADRLGIRFVSDIRNINLEDAKSFIKKLNEKSYPGKYYRLPINEAAKRFLAKHKRSDVLRCLYEFKEGKDLDKRMEEVVERIFETENINVKRIILMLYALNEFADVGLKLRLFLNLFAVEDVKGLLIKIQDVVQVDFSSRNSDLKNVKVKSRYNKLLEKSLRKFSFSERREIVEDILKALSIRYTDRLKNTSTYEANVLYQLLRSQNLRNLFGEGHGKIAWNELFELYKNIHEYYADYHIYWLHRAISEIKYELFDDADIHLTQAETMRQSFEIEHTKSIFYLERAIKQRGLEDIEREELFRKGLEILSNQISDAKIKNDAYSIHTYISRSCQYYKIHNITPSENELRIMYKYYKIAFDNYSGLESVMVRSMLRDFYGLLMRFEIADFLKLNHEEYKHTQNKHSDQDDVDVLNYI